MANSLFTIENSRLAALLHGDPNDTHKNNRFGNVIAPGLMQLQGFISMFRWIPGYAIDVALKKPIVVPNSDIDYSLSEHGLSCILTDGKFIYAEAEVFPQTFNTIAFPISDYKYNLVGQELGSDEIKDWKTYDTIPYNLVSRIVPQTDFLTLQKIALVGASANALAKTLRDNADYLPGLFFPDVREMGVNACLEDRIVLYMGESPNKKEFALQTYEARQNPDNKRGIIATLAESSGLFAMEMYLIKLPVKVLRKLLAS